MLFTPHECGCKEEQAKACCRDWTFADLWKLPLLSLQSGLPTLITKNLIGPIYPHRLRVGSAQVDFVGYGFHFIHSVFEFFGRIVGDIGHDPGRQVVAEILFKWKRFE